MTGDGHRSTEELLRSVLADPAYDVTPEGDPLGPVWGRARAIRRRRALTAGGTAVVVVAALVAGGVAITRPEARTTNVIGEQPTPTASVPAPTSAPTPSANAQPTTTFTRTAVHIEEPLALGDAIVGLETGEGGPVSFRVVRLDTTNGKVTRSAVVAASAGGIAATDGMVWVTSKGTGHLLRFDLADLSQLPDVVDPHGQLAGPIAAQGNVIAVADRAGVSRFRDGTELTPPITDVPSRVCSLTAATGGLYVVRGPQGGACITATYVTDPSHAGVDVADASDASLGLAGLVPDETGFWVEQPTGTMGYYEHVTFSTTSGSPPVPGPTHISGSNGMALSVAGGHAWISDPGLLQCADRNGKVLWTDALPDGAGAAHILSTSTGTVLVTSTYVEPFDTALCTAAGDRPTVGSEAAAASSSAAP